MGQIVLATIFIVCTFLNLRSNWKLRKQLDAVDQKISELIESNKDPSDFWKSGDSGSGENDEE